MERRLSRTVCLDVQTALLDIGVDDVEIAALRDERTGEDIGFDLRVSLDSFPPGNHNGFLDRLLLSVQGWHYQKDGNVPVVKFHWMLSNHTSSARADEFEQFLREEPVQTLKRLIRSRGFKQLAHTAYANMNSTSDSSQA